MAEIVTAISYSIDRNGHLLFCSMVAQVTAEGSRVAKETVRRRGSDGFSEDFDEGSVGVAEFVKDALRKVV